jgi:hypothetical protein
MICREWRERDLVKGPPSTQIPARSMDLRRCSRSTLSSRQTVKDCSESFGMLQSNERPRQWYLRWFRRTVIPIDARMAVSTLESLSERDQKQILVELWCFFNTDCSVGPEFLVAQTWCY